MSHGSADDGKRLGAQRSMSEGEGSCISPLTSDLGGVRGRFGGGGHSGLLSGCGSADGGKRLEVERSSRKALLPVLFGSSERSERLRSQCEERCEPILER